MEFVMSTHLCTMCLIGFMFVRMINRVFVKVNWKSPPLPRLLSQCDQYFEQLLMQDVLNHNIPKYHFIYK